METSENKVKLESRNTHKWKNESCIYCGCLRLKTWNEQYKWWNTEIVDTETGEITIRKQCTTKQIELQL